MEGMANEQISGAVERITYYNEENGYSVLRLKPDSRNMLPFKYASGKDGLITVVGNLPEVQPGEWLKLTGTWTSHAKHGRQFQAQFCEQSLPATTEGIKRYLGSGMIRGVGPVMAERIVNKFGADTLDVIEDDPKRLQEVLGIGQKRVGQIAKAWEEQRAIKDVMIFLQSHGVSTNLATKIYKKYENTSLTVVQNTPYKLVQDIRGIGFKTADQIARALGLALDDPSRIEAGLAYTLNRMAEEGHVYVPQDELVPAAAEILGVEEAKITAVLQALESSDFVKREQLVWGNLPPTAPRLVPDGHEIRDSILAEQSNKYEIGKNNGQDMRVEDAVYLTAFYFAEIGTTKRIQDMISYPTSRLTGITKNLQYFGGAQHKSRNRRSQISQSQLQLAPQQQLAVDTAVANKVTILTGGPGTGKTTTLRALLDLLDANKKNYLLASPTGRAAKRLAEATGRQAKTIHRLLEFNPGEGFGKNEYNLLDADMIVIDEASMLDLVLANTLLKAIGPDTAFASRWRCRSVAQCWRGRCVGRLD